MICVVGGSRSPVVTCASASSYESNARFDGSDSRTAASAGSGSRTPSSYSSISWPSQSLAASGRSRSAPSTSR